jgi:hypothetical protein
MKNRSQNDFIHFNCSLKQLLHCSLRLRHSDESSSCCFAIEDDATVAPVGSTLSSAEPSQIKEVVSFLFCLFPILVWNKAISWVGTRNTYWINFILKRCIKNDALKCFKSERSLHNFASLHLTDRQFLFFFFF